MHRIVGMNKSLGSIRLYLTSLGFSRIRLFVLAGLVSMALAGCGGSASSTDSTENAAWCEVQFRLSRLMLMADEARKGNEPAFDELVAIRRDLDARMQPLLMAARPQRAERVRYYWTSLAKDIDAITTRRMAVTDAYAAAARIETAFTRRPNCSRSAKAPTPSCLIATA
jgi:hypothetical protein